MNLVYYNPTGVIGGGELNLLDVLSSLRARRPEWSLHVIVGDDGPLAGAVEDLGLRCDVVRMPVAAASLGDAALSRGHGSRRARAAIRLATRGPVAAVASAGYLRRLRRAILRVKPDLLQTNGMKAHVLGTWAAPAGLPVVWHLQDYAGSRPLMARLLRWTSRSYRKTRVAAISRSVAEDVRGVVGPRVRVAVVESAVDLERFAPGPGDGPALDREAGLAAAPEGTVRVGLVATYARWKGHDVFLEAAALVPDDLPVRFYVIGGPLYKSAGSQFTRRELERRAEALGFKGRVGFVGHQAAPEAVFRALDVVVHASTRPEPFGRVIVEAMACGRAVVASNEGGAAELFVDGVSALGCTPGDPGALAATLTRLVRDGDLRRSLGQGGRDAAERRFDRRRLAEAWSNLYESAVDQGDPPGTCENGDGPRSDPVAGTGDA